MSLSRLDKLLNELRDMPAAERPPANVLRRFWGLGEISEAPTVEPPDWLESVVGDGVRAVSQRWPQSNFFSAVRMLERLGLVKVTRDDVYVLAMVSCLGDRRDGSVRTDALRRDAELRELVWRVFEVEGGGEVSLANVDKFSFASATWAQTFRELVADGTLPRDRVLESCLRALGRDFSAYRAGWFAGLYRSLEPTGAERAAHQPLLLRLLRSAVPATVSFAVEHLAVVARAGALDDDGYIAECAAAMVVPAKSTAVAAITLAARVAGKRPDLVPAVAEAVGAGLGHAHRDVQSQALTVLQSLAGTEAVAAKEAVAARLNELEPSVRRAAAAWLGAGDTRHDDADTTLAASLVLPGLGAGDATVAELGARLLAGHVGAADVERFLAALVVNDTAGLGALRRQAAKVLSSPQRQRSLRRSLAALVVTAAGEEYPVVADADTFLARRLGEIADVLAGRRAPAPLLATPADAAGWLDPGLFVARLAANPDPPMYDLVAALLRLAPEGRAEALRSARGLPGEPGAVARYALGGDLAEVTTRPLWFAAARSREPLADDQQLVAAGLDLPGQGRAVRYSLQLQARQYRFDQHGKTRVRTTYDASLEVTPPGAHERADQPANAGPWGRGRLSVWKYLDPDWIAWHAFIWPHDAEPFFAVRVEEVLTASHSYPMVTYGTSAVLDALLTHPGRMGPMAAATLAAGLSASEVQHRVLAAEACARLVPAARITAADLASAMACLAGHCTATRWASTLRDAARTGPRAASAVVEVLDFLLPQLGPDHRGAHALLETRYEEAVRLAHRHVSEPLRTWLQGLQGGSKAARTARLILAEAAGSEGSL